MYIVRKAAGSAGMNLYVLRRRTTEVSVRDVRRLRT